MGLDIEFYYDDDSMTYQSMCWGSANYLFKKDFSQADWINYKIIDIVGMEVETIEDPQFIKKIFESFTNRYKSLKHFVIPNKLPIKIHFF